jgi:AraC-like DNA-binding protein
MTGAYFSNPWFAGWGSNLPLLVGPIIYFYTQSLLNKDFVFNSKSWKHFLPFSILFLATEIYFLIQPREIQEKILSNVLRHHIPSSVFVVSTLIFFQFLFYIIASFRLVSSYKNIASKYFSDKRQTDVSWLSSMILFFLLIIILTILNGLLSQTSFSTYYLVVFNIIILAVLIFVITVLLKALQKPYFFSFSDSDFSNEEPPSLTKVGWTDLERIQKKETVQMILNYTQNKKPYLEPELTLEQLASQLSLRPRVLSQVINEILGQNFYDFINRHRIEEASRLLTNPKDKKITILEVLYEVGFNSKSNFNTLFKKYTGLTPTEFRKKQAG